MSRCCGVRYEKVLCQSMQVLYRCYVIVSVVKLGMRRCCVRVGVV